MDQLEAERAARTMQSEAAIVSTAGADVFTTRLDGPAPEVTVSTDMINRGLLAAPLLIAVCAVIWGGDGAWSAAYGIAIVLANFALAAGDHRHDGPDLPRADDGRHPVRLPHPPRPRSSSPSTSCKDTSWISLPALGATIIVTHLGLLSGS